MFTIQLKTARDKESYSSIDAHKEMIDLLRVLFFIFYIINMILCSEVNWSADELFKPRQYWKLEDVEQWWLTAAKYLTWKSIPIDHQPLVLMLSAWRRNGAHAFNPLRLSRVEVRILIVQNNQTEDINRRLFALDTNQIQMDMCSMF